jgi:outer membrane protein TolC
VRLDRERQLVAVEVAAAYYGVVAQRAVLAASQKSLERSRRLLEASQAKLEAGLVSQLDTLRALQLVAAAELNLSGSDGASQDAYDQLRLVMGRESSSEFGVVEVIADKEDAMTADDAVALALRHREDLRSAAAIADDADRAVAFSKNQLRPQLDANLAFTRRKTSPTFAQSFGADGFQVATFFTASLPVDRTPHLIDYQNALVERDRRRRNVEAVRRAIENEVRRAVRGRDQLQREVKAAAVAVEITKKEVEVAQLRYERGLSNNLDVVNAEGNLLAAESRQIGARAELAIARLRLRAIIGILDVQKDFAQF